MTVPRQCTLIVLDSVGIGELPDADTFGDIGSDTLGHIASFRHEQGRPLRIPNLQRLGIANVTRDAGLLTGVPPIEEPAGAFARMVEVAPGKDTATGHWEFMGLVPETPFATFPDGFPSALIDAFCAAIGQPAVLGNVAASGTAIIEELGAEHQRTGHPIVYTSADPVFQIAAHEDVVPVETLYAWCEAAYALCIPAGMSRVIARPFVGTPGAYTRTHRRKDYALAPPTPTYLDDLAAAGIKTLGVGKIGSIYSQQGIAGDVHTKSNADGIEQTLAAMRSREFDFVFTNLVDFDMLYGHRRNPEGYATCLEEFDRALPSLLAAMDDDDLMLITADHGNDPTYRGTDHTREYVPLLAIGSGVRAGADLGTRATFADVGRTVAHYFNAPSANPRGTSILSVL